MEESNTGLCVASGDEVVITVDAHTGEVVGWEPGGYMGAGPRKANLDTIKKLNARKPGRRTLTGPLLHKGSLLLDGIAYSDVSYLPVELEGTGYIYAKYLPMLYGGAIKWASGIAELRVGGRRFILRPGVKSIECEGKTKKLMHAPRILFGRIYIPHQAIGIMTGGKAVWDAKTKALSITSSGMPLKPRFRRYVPPASNDK